MKYRNTSLKGQNNYYLVRNNDFKTFSSDLEKLREKNLYLADNIHGFSEIYDESSKHQAYLIYDEQKECLGGIVIIAPLFANEPLELKMSINEEKVSSENRQFKIVDDIVNLLGRSNYSSKKIVIKLDNDLSLSKWNGLKYQQRVNKFVENDYICNNLYHEEITATLKEIFFIRHVAEENGVEEISETVMADSKKFIYPIDNTAITEYRSNRVPFAEIFDKADIYNITATLPDNSITNINLRYDGEVTFDNSQLHAQIDWDKNYQGSYNLLNNSFSLQDYSHKNLEISSNQEAYSLKNNVLTITNSKEHNLKKIVYQTEITDNNTSITGEVVIKNGEIKHYYTDLKIHRENNQKVKGTYMLRWNFEKGLSFSYRNRKGMLFDLTDALRNENQELYYEALSSNANIETLDKLLLTIITRINNETYQFAEFEPSKQIAKLEKDTVNFLEEVSKEALSPSLKERIIALKKELKIDNKILIKK